MALKLFDFQETFMVVNFFMKLTQFEKIGPIGKIFIALENLKIQIQFRDWKSLKFFSRHLDVRIGRWQFT